jgi:hypothetical protein
MNSTIGYGGSDSIFGNRTHFDWLRDELPKSPDWVRTIDRLRELAAGRRRGGRDLRAETFVDLEARLSRFDSRWSNAEAKWLGNDRQDQARRLVQGLEAVALKFYGTHSCAEIVWGTVCGASYAPPAVEAPAPAAWIGTTASAMAACYSGGSWFGSHVRSRRNQLQAQWTDQPCFDQPQFGFQKDI